MSDTSASLQRCFEIVYLSFSCVGAIQLSSWLIFYLELDCCWCAPPLFQLAFALLDCLYALALLSELSNPTTTWGEFWIWLIVISILMHCWDDTAKRIDSDMSRLFRRRFPEPEREISEV
jgi:hypothetical protein